MTRRIIAKRGYDRADPQGEFIRISAEATNDYVPRITDRDDVIVMIAEGEQVGHGAPAAFVPDLAEVEVNAKWLNLPAGMKLRDFTMTEYGWKEKVPEFVGLLIHEAAGHANHSLWMTEELARRENLPKDKRSWLNAATLLEESRIEVQALRERPVDHDFLAASATDIALRELSKQFVGEAAEDKIVASRMAALIMSRVDAGIIEHTPDISDIKSRIIGAVGSDVYAKMQDIWRDAHDTEDDDTEGMLDLGRRWVELTGDDGGEDGGEGEGLGEGQGDPKDGEGDGSGNAATEGMKEVLGKVAKQARDQASGDAAADEAERRRRAYVAERQSAAKEKQEAEKEASKVFHAAPASQLEKAYNSLAGYRAPTGEERALVTKTRKELESAYTRERHVTKKGSQRPPGRVRMKGAMQGAAMRDRGVPDTSEPFVRKQRRRDPVPPLRVGIIQDASGSQDRAAAGSASGAWVVASAAHQLDAQVAMVTFGNTTTRVISPGEKPPGVPRISANSGNHKFSWAIKALEGALDMMNPNYARLLIIMTDGIWEDIEVSKRDRLIKRFVEAGVHVMWVRTDGGYGYGGYDNTPNVRGVNIIDASGNLHRLPQIIAKGASETLGKEVGL